MSTFVEKKGLIFISSDHHGRQPIGYNGGVVEYEPTIIIDGVEIPESQRAAYLAQREERRKHAEADHRSAELREARNKINFPFYTDAGGALLGKRPARSDVNSGMMSDEKCFKEDSKK